MPCLKDAMLMENSTKTKSRSGVRLVGGHRTFQLCQKPSPVVPFAQGSLCPHSRVSTLQTHFYVLHFRVLHICALSYRNFTLLHFKCILHRGAIYKRRLDQIHIAVLCVSICNAIGRYCNLYKSFIYGSFVQLLCFSIPIATNR